MAVNRINCYHAKGNVAMFTANQFYPTPAITARKMFDTLRSGRSIKRLLEPSAGKGDLLEATYGSFEVKAIELNPDLAATLKGKGYTVIGDDFLEFNEIESYDSILMNPPFNEGIAHLFHAWDILAPNGRIVCLLPATVLNDGNGQKQRLSQLISTYGTVEHLGDCFQGAERRTNVEVVMITLNKPKPVASFDPSQFKYELEDFESAIATPKSNVLGRSDVIKTLVHQYELAVEALRQKYIAKEQLSFALSGIATYSSRKRGYREEDLIGGNNYPSDLAELKGRFWQTVFHKTELESRATSDFKRKFSEWEQEQIGLAFTESNIRNMLLMFWQNKEQIDMDSLCHVFDMLTRNHANCVVGEGWKTNKASKLNTKVIIERGIEYDQWGFSTSYRKQDDYDDIDKAMCILSGKKITEICKIASALSNFVHNIKKGEVAYTDKFESEFFTGKIFKKGTVHLWFKDVTLNEEFNRRVATQRKWIGSDY